MQTKIIDIGFENGNTLLLVININLEVKVN